MELDKIEGQPDDKVAWGSDVAAQMLRRFGIPYMSLTPGASYRGFHDSVVNHLGNKDPGMILCLHEDHAVAVAHGWTKVTGKPMACALHSNVGLIHGMMSMYNAWCDRAPMIVIGATGPLDNTQRRPWIDWIHTTRDQGAWVRSMVKWDDLPSSPQAIVEGMTRGNMLTQHRADRAGLHLPRRRPAGIEAGEGAGVAGPVPLRGRPRRHVLRRKSSTRLSRCSTRARRS